MPEFWKWLETGLLDTVVQQKDPVGQTLPHDEWGYLLSYNRVIGGIRLIQERGKSRRCDYRRMDAWYPECHPYDSKSKASFGYQACGSNASIAMMQDLLDDYDTIHNLTACYDAAPFAGAVDVRNDEGFTLDKKSGYFEL